jgi:hypothetical protein
MSVSLSPLPEPAPPVAQKSIPIHTPEAQRHIHKVLLIVKSWVNATTNYQKSIRQISLCEYIKAHMTEHCWTNDTLLPLIKYQSKWWGLGDSIKTSEFVSAALSKLLGEIKYATEIQSDDYKNIIEFIQKTQRHASILSFYEHLKSVEFINIADPAEASILTQKFILFKCELRKALAAKSKDVLLMLQ